jgi:hypothetical protein
MRIFLALTIAALVATPALAGGNKQKTENKIDSLNRQIGHVVVTPSDNRREQLDRLEVKLARALFVRNNQENK